MMLSRKLRAVALAIILAWGWKRAAIALVAGALSSLAMAPFNAWPILFVTFPVMVWLIDGATPGRRSLKTACGSSHGLPSISTWRSRTSTVCPSTAMTRLMKSFVRSFGQMKTTTSPCFGLRIPGSWPSDICVSGISRRGP